MHRTMAAVIIVAHAPLASALKLVASHVYADCGHDVLALDVAPDTPPEQVRDQARALMQGGNEADWLVLTDVFGATPCNAALMLADPLHVRVVTGVNVPMLWRTLCYADESLDALVTRAVGGGTHGVMHLAPTRPQNQNQPQAPARDPVHRHHQQ
jgi:PTS system ascorbate-specific IIA component